MAGILLPPATLIEGLAPELSEPSGLFAPASFAGPDFHIAAYVPPSRVKRRREDGPAASVGASYKLFAELQTLTVTSHRGTGPVRVLGETAVRGFTRGTRTFGGTLVFSVLSADVFRELYAVSRSESWIPYPTVVDRLPPFTITVVAVNEFGQTGTLAVIDCVIQSQGMTLSIDDIRTETQYSYQAVWATPFIDIPSVDLLTQLTTSTYLGPQRLSSFGAGQRF